MRHMTRSRQFIGRFINDSHNLYSAHMHYVFCYFRPDNKFPNRIFGGLARELKDPAGCSLDTFAYFHYQRPVQNQGDLPASWELTPAQPEDGFTVRRDEPDLDELQKTFECADAETRRMMQIALESKQPCATMQGLEAAAWMRSSRTLASSTWDPTRQSPRRKRS